MTTKHYAITIQSGANPAPHELAAIEVLATVAPVIVLAPRRTAGMRTPDVHWLGKDWEIKSPKGKGRNLIHNTVHRAARQSANIIIDLQRSQVYELTALRAIRRISFRLRKIHHVKVITKSHKIIDIKP